MGLAVMGLLALVVGYQLNFFRDISRNYDVYRQRIKLPPSEALRFLTLGYDNVYANYLWLQSIQNFGQGWVTENLSTEPIYQYFDTMSDVDPHFIAPYRFANLIIGDNRLDWTRGQDILRKGIFKNPENFDLPYLGLYNAIWQYDNQTDARWFAHFLNRNPSAPGFMRRLKEFIERRAGRFDAALDYNVRYMVEYRARKNPIEAAIIERRLGVMLDEWYRAELSNAARRYHARYGFHPWTMEDILAPDIRADFVAPTPEGITFAFEAAQFDIEAINPNREIPQDLVDGIIQLASERHVGLPPEPNGFWYYISPQQRQEVIRRHGIRSVGEVNQPLSYIISARQATEGINGFLAGAQGLIQQHVRVQGEKPGPAEILPLIGRDTLGGHFGYNRDAPESPQYGVFYSTGTFPQVLGMEPRMGLRGPGPFPFPILPKLRHSPQSLLWGLAFGYILPDGREVWSYEEREQLLREPAQQTE